MKFLFNILLLVSFTAQAQMGKEAWNWQFGFYCSLDFSLGNPAVAIDSIFAEEGTASISDVNTGQLLFYTDGTNAWDRNNHRMPNGYGMIGGEGTSTQAALIVPKPGSQNMYYLFSADQAGYCCGTNPVNHGVHYSVVDMNLNGGLGDVITSSKNILLTPPPTTEKLTAVKHCNGIDYWVITHSFNSNAFNVYLVNASGINATPVISNVGTMQTHTSALNYLIEAVGYLKASPNGKKLACAVQYMQFTELFDFDNSTGIVSNPIKITGTPQRFYPYGVAFSPDNSKLYVTANDSIAVNSELNLYLYEYFLGSGTSAGIMNSRITIDSLLDNAGALQLAPDNKIYLNDHSSKLFVINNPNGIGANCNYTHNGTAQFPYGEPVFGLPNFIEANTITPVSNLRTTSLCAFNSYTLASNGNNNISWSTGDTTHSTSIHTFGTYWVSYLNASGCKEIDSFNIVQTYPPVINLLHDSTVCSNTPAMPVQINASDTGNVSYVWNDGFASPIRTITYQGNYWVNYTFSNFCISRDSFTFNIYNYPSPINFSNDTFCLGNKQLNAYSTGCSYLWNTGETTSSIYTTHPGNYWVQVNYKGCKTYDSLTIYPQYDAFNFTVPNIVTPNNDGVNDLIDFGKYQFSTMQLEIYNRWGNKIFESNTPNCIWKPTEDDGTYFLLINYSIDCGSEIQTKTIKSFVTLVR